MRNAIIAISLAVASLHGSVDAAVPSGISGTWYNAAQNGHGVSIEVIDETRVIAFWYVYDTNGQPVHLYIDGRINGRTISGTAYRASGMRFGQFDPATLSLDIWGQVDLDVLSCQSVRMRYRGNGPAGAGYGAGEIALGRLSQLRDLPWIASIDSMAYDFSARMNARKAARSNTMEGRCQEMSRWMGAARARSATAQAALF